MNNAMPPTEYPRFFADAELRVVEGEGGKRKIVGYAAIYNARSENLGGFVEEVAPGAFTDALAANTEVLALVEHSPDKILGRRSMGTLSLSEDARGLRVEIDPPNTTVGNDAVENVRRGDIKGMSFRFPKGAKDSWRSDKGDNVRTLHKVGLLEVTLTSVPAYAQTSVSLRALTDKEEADMKAYYAEQIAALQPKPQPVTTTRLKLAEKRFRLLAGETRCGCYSDPCAIEGPDPDDAVAYVLYSCRSAFDAATEALEVLGDPELEVDEDLVRACADASKAVKDLTARLKEFTTACGAVSVSTATDSTSPQ